ncbi:3-deoxy-manno-octulosonate cytidylyltransferase [Pseudaestuariivita rosea]|uniref:3-deoxy-manno-octulosonate cytidylyltransferase n=1 Tax=Pseudaestuariivita rosea TaxID=2763263 RepID=UPI001ABB0FD7|nr:manno-octulosonate cytidylyltransferase [Pseudaestuariivita rosea]
MSVLVVIPARYASVRYPGKPLVELTGATGQKKSLVQRTWQAALQVNGVDRVVVATDDDRIARASQAFGAQVIMTSESCGNGTERCAETYEKIGSDFDIVVNLQGDAPLTPHWFIENLIAGLRGAPDADVATPVLRCDGAALAGLLADRKAGRVGGTTAVFDHKRHALYFSKEVIPFTSSRYEPSQMTPVYHHAGVYAYRPTALLEYPKTSANDLEKNEGLEQLRFLERGQTILCVEVDAKGRQFWELNNPEDVPKIEEMMRQMGLE